MTDSGAAGDAEVGAVLTRAREALGLSIADIAQQLKFAPRQIEALEQGRFEDLPAGTFARGMLRSYARLLKLDPEPLLESIAPRVAAPDNAAAVASARKPIPIVDNTRRVNLTYAALSIAMLAVIVGVVAEWQRERSGAAKLSFVPAATQPEPAQRAPEPVQTTPVPLQLAAVPAPVAEAAKAQPAPAPRSAAEGVRRIVMKFERPSWVEIRGRDGKTLISQLNQGGTEQTVEGRPPFALIIGNAQHVRLSYDDRPIDLAPHVKVEVARFTLD